MAKGKLRQKLDAKFKIEKIPKTVSQSLPFRGMTPTGIIETKIGNFTKCYHFDDINFQLATTEEQMKIVENFGSFLSSFNNEVKWQFSIFSHKIDKMKTMESLRIKPRGDGLNKYRKELNAANVKLLTDGSNAITQDKYLTVSVEDEKLEHAAETLKRVDSLVANGMEKLTGSSPEPMRAVDRINLLYKIYNQDFDYRIELIDDAVNSDNKHKHTHTLSSLEKQGVSIRDLIGPSSIDFGPKTYFMLGDGKYARTMYLERTANSMDTDFIASVTDIQSDMLISITYEMEDRTKAEKLVKGRLAQLRGAQATKSKNAMADGYFTDISNPEANESIKGAEELLSDLQSRDLKLLYVTFTVTIFADTKADLENVTQQIKTIADSKGCAFKTINGQQEFAFNTCLPLCRNDLFVDTLHTTETASIFIPFKSKDVSHKNAICYGLNETSKNLILYDRLSGSNYNGLVFGVAGSGKSFTTKIEMLNVLLNKDDAQIFVIDPQGEYAPMVEALGGARIVLETGGNDYLNPLDLNLTQDDEGGKDPIATKSDFILSMLDFMSNGNIEPAAESIVDRAVRKIYKSYVQNMIKRTDGVTCDASTCPTLIDLYEELRQMDSPLADGVNTYLEKYTTGSFTIFSHRTNIKTEAKFVVYDLKSLSEGMWPLGLHICINDVLNRMKSNFTKGIYTWFYIDEFHLLLKIPSSTRNVANIWRMARKWKGVPTGITQSTEDLLASDDARAIYKNTFFGIFLFMKDEIDRQNLQIMFGLTEAQAKTLAEPKKGRGLLYNGKFTLPYSHVFPENTELYRLMDTAKKNEKGVYKNGLS